MSGNAYVGIRADQDSRFADKQAALLRKTPWPADFAPPHPDLGRVQWEALRPWVERRVTELLGVEDEVLVAYVLEEIEGKAKVDPRALQLNLTGFLERNAGPFVRELWALLRSPSGIPQQFLDEKAAELAARGAERRADAERADALRRSADAARAEVLRAAAAQIQSRAEPGAVEAPRRRERSRSRSRSRSRADRRRRRRSRSRSRGRRRRSRSRSRGRRERRRPRSPSRGRGGGSPRRERRRDDSPRLWRGEAAPPSARPK
jgi:serine/arginine repetitive matrix protein 1